MPELPSQRRNLALALVFGAAAWVLGALNRSLWIDEFHTLEHARKESVAAVLQSLHGSNHPPLTILLVHWSERWLGSGQLALRWWGLVLGLVTVAMAAHVARRLPEGPGRRAVPWLVVASSYAFTIFTEIRMYGFLALCVLGLLEAMLASFEGRRRAAWWALPWIAVGLHAHYYFLYYGFVLALAAVALAVLRPSLRKGLWHLLPPAALGVLSFLPWALTGFVAQLGHDRPSGGSTGYYLDLDGFAQSLAHLLFMNASVAGRWLTLGVALPGALAGGVLAAIGIGRLWRARSKEGPPTFELLLAAAVGVPVFGFVLAVVWDRAGYNWRYIAGSCVPVLMLVAGGIAWRPLWRGALSAVLFATMALVTVVNVFSPGQEDYRGCVRYVLEHARPGDAVLLRPVREVHPEISPTGWDYYRGRVSRPEGAPEPATYRLTHWREALAHDRVWTYVRYRYPQEILDELNARYPMHEKVQLGPVMTVHLWSR